MSTYLRKWQRLENYKLQEASLAMLFRDFCPANMKMEHVLLKVSALNDFYSTRIFDTYTVAKHILSEQIDKPLAAGDYSLVNRIARVSIRGKQRNFYSFASKYCNHHRAERYPIFDSYVETMLTRYEAKDGFGKFKKADLKNYERFIEVIEGFRKFYGLDRYSLREIDIFLWLAGKEWFPRKYK